MREWALVVFTILEPLDSPEERAGSERVGKAENTLTEDQGRLISEGLFFHPALISCGPPRNNKHWCGYRGRVSLNQQSFVRLVHTAVRNNAIQHCRDMLLYPSERQPMRWLGALGAWYQAMSPADREAVDRVIQLAVDDVVYAFLMLLDNQAVGRADPPGSGLELIAVDLDGRQLLNNTEGWFLRDKWDASFPMRGGQREEANAKPDAADLK